MDVAKFMRRLCCLTGVHEWAYDTYSDAAGSSRHRDCKNCGKHEELPPLEWH